MQLTVSQQIAVPKAQMPPKVHSFLREKLFISNSEYIVKQRMGKPVYDIPKFFDLIEDDSSNLLIPRGFLEQLTAFLDKEHILHEVVYAYPQFGACGYKSAVTLTQEQRRIVETTFAVGQGVIVAPPGSGKTVMGLELIAQHEKPALVLTHRKQLLDQWVDSIQTQLGIPKKQIGRYSSAYKKPGKQVTVGLLQSFARMKDLSAFTNQFGVIVVDECHHIPAATFRTVISHLNAPHVYGLTATPKRKYNDERLIYLYIGAVVASMNAPAETSTQKEAVGFDIAVEETSLQLPFNQKQDQFELLAKTICYDTRRNEQVTQDILAQVKLKRRTLVLSERKEHLKVLELYLHKVCKTLVFSGDDPVSKRTLKLEQIKNGDYEVLLATGQILGEGMHIPSVEVLVFAFPFAFPGKLVQYVGRLSHSKSPYRLIDYRDAKIEILERQYKQRRRYYNKITDGARVV